MGYYDTIFAELDCPFCGKQYRHTPVTREKAEKLAKQNKQKKIDLLQDHKKSYTCNYNVQELWADDEGYSDVELWIAQLDSSENIEKCRTFPSLGLAEIPIEEWGGKLKAYYVGDRINQYWGHYFIQESFACDGCRIAKQPEKIHIWLEIEDRILKAVLTYNPETGQPEKE
jgi:hypothetical protein